MAPGEVVRGEPSSFLLKVKNLGSEPFPGGEIRDIRFRYFEDYALYSEQHQLPELIVGGEIVVDSMEIIPFDTGVSWIDLAISSSDDEPIECYQSREGDKVGTNSGRNLFYSVSREDVAIIALLKDLQRHREST